MTIIEKRTRYKAAEAESLEMLERIVDGYGIFDADTSRGQELRDFITSCVYMGALAVLPPSQSKQVFRNDVSERALPTIEDVTGVVDLGGVDSVEYVRRQREAR